MEGVDSVKKDLVLLCFCYFCCRKKTTKDRGSLETLFFVVLVVLPSVSSQKIFDNVFITLA